VVGGGGGWLVGLAASMTAWLVERGLMDTVFKVIRAKDQGAHDEKSTFRDCSWVQMTLYKRAK
jgi:hypothetical protein